MSPLTPLRRRILTMLHDHHTETGIMLTQREIAERLGVTGTCVHKHIVSLEEGGFLDRLGSAARNIAAVRLPGRALMAEEVAWCHAHAAQVRAMMVVAGAVS